MCIRDRNGISLSKKASLKQISQGSTNARNQHTNSQYNGSNQVQQTPQMVRSSSQPINFKKGKIAKGLNYDSENLSIFAKAKIKELENRLENTKMQFRHKEMYFKILKEKVVDHVVRQNCGDGVLEKCLSEPEI